MKIGRIRVYRRVGSGCRVEGVMAVGGRYRFVGFDWGRFRFC